MLLGFFKIKDLVTVSDPVFIAIAVGYLLTYTIIKPLQAQGQQHALLSYGWEGDRHLVCSCAQ